MSDAVDAFIAHGLSVDWAALPVSAKSAVKTFLLDSLGVGIAGAGAPLARNVRAVALGWAGEGDAHVWGAGSISTTPASAAFINGFQIHCQEYDCVHEGAVVHPMATLLAALMAECDARRDVSGAYLGAAIAAGVDMSAGLGLAAKSPLKFFRPATAGIFGATLGLCRLRRYDHARTRDALGYALGFASGTMQAHAEGKPALPVQIANAARGAVMAADLAGAGLSAAANSLQGPFGYLNLFETAHDIAPIVEALGITWRISEVSHKPYPTGRAAQGGLRMVQGLVKGGLRADEIESVILTAPPLIERLVGRPAMSDMSASYARLCFAYLGAVAFQRGDVGLEDFSQGALCDAETLRLAARIRVEVNHITDPAAFTPQTLTVALKSGAVKTAETHALFGSPGDPLSAADNESKFRSCVAFGFGAGRTALADRLIGAVKNLESLRDAGLLSRLAAGQEA